MSESSTDNTSSTATGHGGHGPAEPPTAEEIRAMSTEEAMIAGAVADDIHIVHRRQRFPVRGTKAEKRAERGVALCFAISALCGVAFVVYFCAGKWHWTLPTTDQQFRYFTPVLGGTLGGMALFLGIGLVLWAKWLMPEEEAVQDRHDTPSTEEDKLYTEATLLAGLEDTGLPRRGLILRTMGLAVGAFATVPLVAIVGAMIKKPGDKLDHTLFQSKWAPTGSLLDGKPVVPLVYSDWRRVSPDDIEPGGVATVFPGVREEVDGDDGLTSASSPTLLIRLRPGQTVKARKGQNTFGWPAENPEYIAFSKICTHAGCPASLYEQQTGRLLCPCHQSQFQVLEDAEPVFGPASRPLPKLPLGVVTGDDGRQYFVAKSDYVEPIGPAFWNRSFKA